MMTLERIMTSFSTAVTLSFHLSKTKFWCWVKIFILGSFLVISFWIHFICHNNKMMVTQYIVRLCYFFGYWSFLSDFCGTKFLMIAPYFTWSELSRYKNAKQTCIGLFATFFNTCHVLLNVNWHPFEILGLDQITSNVWPQ